MILIAVCLATPAFAARNDDPEAPLQKALAGRTAGPPVDCIISSSTDSSQIIDRKAILYRIGSRIFVNEPRSGADTLREDDILVTRTFGSRLCSRDMVQLIHRGSRFPGRYISLGKFVPYSRVKAVK